MHIDVEHSNCATTMRLAGSFEMGAQRSFHKAHRQLLTNKAVQTLSLDLSRVDYIDSSALGMLLLLKREAEKNSVPITLSGARPMVLRVLKFANFHKLFKLT